MSDYAHILVAIDFSPAAEKVAERAVNVARCCGASLTFLHVVEYLPPMAMGDEVTPSPVWMVDETALVQSSRASLQAFVKKLGQPNAEHLVTQGTTQYEITQHAKDHNVDLIVMGSHGRHGVGLLLGSTANAVLHHASCDVLAVRVHD
ncbi:MAG: universal stress protein [Gammaproteobacteria bacterium]|nr:universal stress protein [Gammaproteobacteria bacterium]